MPAATTYLGTSFDAQTDLDVGWFRPTEDSWDQKNDRGITCYLYRVDAGKLNKTLKGAGASPTSKIFLRRPPAGGCCALRPDATLSPTCLALRGPSLAVGPYLNPHGFSPEVLIARRTGFCYGVREAIDYARLAAAQGKQTHTLGQVVHNEGVIAQLEAQGIQTVDTLDDVDHGAAVVIRAHGVTPEVMARAEERGLEVIDGTCTWVIQEQKELQKLVEEGYTIVLLGTPNHPEVVGLLGFAPDAIVVDEEEDWERIPRTKRMALISQSTQPPWKFEKLAAYLVSRSHELKIVNTVCPVTIRRQQDTMELAEQVDMMVVVGGRNSANTKELTRLCEIAGKPVIQIESEHDLDDARRFGGARVVGVTGGTCDADRGPREGRRARLRAGRHRRRRRRTPRAGARRRSPRSPSRPTGAARSTSTAAPRRARRPPARPRLMAARRGRRPTSEPRREDIRPRACRSSPSSAGPMSARARSSTGVVGERMAIVEDRARTTRDRLYDVAEWNGRRFIVIDTGGLETQPGDPIEERVQEQAGWRSPRPT